MSDEGASADAKGTLIFGETVLDLVRHSGHNTNSELATFGAYPGGTGANVAVALVRAAARGILMSGVGPDPWGDVLRKWLEAEGVDLRWFVAPTGAVTPVSLIDVGPAGEPTIDMHCEALGAIADACAAAALQVLKERSRAVFIASNTLVGVRERLLTLALQKAALDHGLPVCFDINLRKGRWANLTLASRLCKEIISTATLVKCNGAEAAWLTGCTDANAAADTLIGSGAANVVLTLGAEGALVKGSVSARIPGSGTHVQSTLGAGDALIGTVLGKLALLEWDMTALPDAVADGVAAATAVAETWGAVYRPAGWHAISR